MQNLPILQAPLETIAAIRLAKTMFYTLCTHLPKVIFMNKALFIAICLFVAKTNAMEEGAQKAPTTTDLTMAICSNQQCSAQLIRKTALLENTMLMSALYAITKFGEARIRETLYVGPLVDERDAPLISPDGTLLLAWGDPKRTTLYTIATRTGETLRSDTLPKGALHASLAFKEDNTIVVMQNSEDDIANIAQASQKKWLDAGFDALKKIYSTSKGTTASPLYRHVHVFNSGMIAAFFSDDRQFTCLSKKKANGYSNTLHKTHNHLSSIDISRIIWGTGRNIAAISSKSLSSIIFCDFSQKINSDLGVEVPPMDNCTIGCFSPEGNLFVCANRKWLGQILVINCQDALNALPLTTLSISNKTETISQFNWHASKGLYAQTNWHSYELFPQESHETTTEPSSDSSPKTSKEATE